MKAMYRNRLCSLIETVGDLAVLANEDGELPVSLGDKELVVDPTDEEIAGAENLPQWYGVGGERVADLRALLRGESPPAGPDTADQRDV